jgi:hypothetical protein
MNSIKWMFGYLLFHRKIILGILLVLGLAFWLMYGIDFVPRISLKGDGTATQNAQPRKLPELEVFTRPKPKTEAETEAETLTGLEVDPNPTPVSDEESVVNENDDSSRQETRFDRWLANASIDELVEQCLRLDQEWRQNGSDYPYVFLLLSKRKRISERLLEKDLTDFQHRFATVSFLESLSVLDSTNVHGKLGSEWVRSELTKNAEKYLNHEEQEIASLAYLSFTVIPGYEFINTPSAELLIQLEQAIDQHYEEIAKSHDCVEKLAELIVVIYTSKTLRNETKVFAEKAIQRFQSDTSDTGIERFQLMQDQFYFGRLDVMTLVDRVSSRQPKVDADVREFATALEQYPNASLKVHQLALDIIREYIRQERKDMARQLVQQIE